MIRKSLQIGASMVFIFAIMAAAVTWPGTAQAQCSSTKAKKAKVSDYKDACKSSCTRTSSSCCPSACKSGDKQAMVIKELSTDLPYHEAKRLVVEGEYLCGKCSFDKLDTCQGFIKTGDGKLYPLIKNGKFSGMCKSLQAKKHTKFEVVGHVRIVDGVKFIDVTRVAKI